MLHTLPLIWSCWVRQEPKSLTTEKLQRCIQDEYDTWSYLNVYIYIYVYVCVRVCGNRLSTSRMWRKVYFMMISLTCFDSKFSFSLSGGHTNVKEPNLPYYLPKSRGKIFEYIPFWHSKFYSFLKYIFVIMSLPVNSRIFPVGQGWYQTVL